MFLLHTLRKIFCFALFISWDCLLIYCNFDFYSRWTIGSFTEVLNKTN